MRTTLGCAEHGQRPRDFFPLFWLRRGVQDVQGPLVRLCPRSCPVFPVPSVHLPAFEVANRSPLMSSILRGKPDDQRILKPQLSLVLLDYLWLWGGCKLVGFINRKLLSNVHLGSNCDIAQGLNNECTAQKRWQFHFHLSDISDFLCMTIK